MMSFGSFDITASSKLHVERKHVEAGPSVASNVKGSITHSIGVARPSTFTLRFVNLQIKEYTKSDSQRSRGCVALDGGHK